MPPPRRWHRHARVEEIAHGYFHFLKHDVYYGGRGIEGLRYFLPMAQNDWAHDGTANHSMSQVFDSGTSRLMTRITAGAGGSITSVMRKRIALPPDFGHFPATGIEVMVRGSNPLPTSVKVSVLKNGAADSVVNDLVITPSVVSTFEAKSIHPADTYNPEDFITLVFKVQTANVNDWAEIGDIAANYINKRGNFE